MMGFFKGKQQRQGAIKQDKAKHGYVGPTAPDNAPEKAPRRFSRWTQEQRDNLTANARARFKARWAIMSTGQKDGIINLNNPQVRLEWELCDVNNLRLVYKGRHTEEFLSNLPADCRALYYQVDPDGKTYKDTVEKPAYFIGFLKAIGILRRGDKKEIEDLIRQFDETAGEIAT